MKEPRIPEDPQARITAYLLGELGVAEAEEVCRKVEEDPEWGALHDRLRQAIGLIREVMGKPLAGGGAASAAGGGIRFSEGRRAALLRQFKVVPMVGVGAGKSSKRRVNWLAVAALLVVAAVLAGMLLPSLAKSKAKGMELAARRDAEEPQDLRFLGESSMSAGPSTEPEPAAEPDMMVRYGVRPTSRVVDRQGGVVIDAVKPPEMPAGLRDRGRRRLQTEEGFGGGGAVGGIGGGGGLEGQGIGTSAAGGRGGLQRELMRQEIVLPAAEDGLRERYGIALRGGPNFGRGGEAAGKPVVQEWAMNRGTTAGFGVVNGPAASTPVLGDAFGLKTETASAASSAFGDFANDGDMISLVDAPAQRESVVMFDTGASAPAGGATVVPADGVALGRETTTFFAGTAVVPERPEVQVQSALRQQTRAAPAAVTRGLAVAPQSSVAGVAGAGEVTLTDLKERLNATVQGGAELVEANELARLDAVSERTGVEVEDEARVRLLRESRVAGRRTAGDASLGVALSNERVEPAVVLATPPVELAKRKDAAGGAVGELSLGFVPVKGQVQAVEGRLMEEQETLWVEADKEKVPALSVVERLGELDVAQQEAKQVASVDHYYAMVTNASVGFSSLGDAVVAGGAYGNLQMPIEMPVQSVSADVDSLAVDEDLGRRPAPVPPLVQQLEVQVLENPFSTFSLNVADVSFKLAQASLEQGRLPEPGSIRSEEFINAFRYHDPAPVSGRRVGVTWERARYPFAHNRDLLRFGVQVAARGREANRPLNLVLCIDSSGSMKRADRVAILRSAMEVLAGQLRPEDRFSVVAFARTARLISSGLDGTRAEELVRILGQLNPEGGTNLEDALRLAYESAHANYVAGGVNRVVLLTDGAANLGNVDGEALRQWVIRERKNGIAMDSFGVGWEGYNDELLETLSRNGDGRYGFLNSPDQVAVDFADQLAGALRVAASDVKVQMEFNARRVKSYRQIGYAKHQLTKEQFRDNTVDAAELGAAEAGQALYVVETDPAGVGPVGTLRVRFKVPGTDEVQEEEWMIPYEGQAVDLAGASPAMRLAGAASAFSEWLAESPYAAEVTAPRLLDLLRGVPESFELEPRPGQLEWMIRQAGSIFGR